MSGIIIPIQTHRNYRFPKVELPESFTEIQKILGLRDPGKPRAFEFRIREKGCEVWLKFTGGLSLNLSAENGYLKNRAEGRLWAIEFAKRYGFTPMEQSKPPKEAG